MSWDDDEFERELMIYSEIETVPEEETLGIIVPETIQRYQQRIQSNNTASIFDADYSVPATNGDFPEQTSQNSDLEEKQIDIFKDHENIIRCVSGRGRGGRNVYHKPGDQSKLPVNDDEDIIQQLRKVAPIGYSNEITELAVKAHHKAKQIGKEPNTQSSSPSSISKSSSPSTIIESRIGSLKESKTPISITSSRTSTPSNRSSAKRSDYYLTSRDDSNSNDSQLSERISLDESETELDVQKPNDNNEVANGVAHSPVVESNKPIPLSEMLRLSREQHRQRQIERRKNTVQNNEVDLATQLKIEDILRQDRMSLTSKRETKRLSNPSVSTSSSREDVLPWRRRTNSPPKYEWGKQSKWKRREELNINSTLDFPPLK